MLKSSTVELKELYNTCDILFLQETWLCEQELSFLNTISQDFYSLGTSSMNDADGMRQG